MDYAVVSKSAQEVIGNYLRNPKGYEEGLKNFYVEGSKNPSVARILYHNEIIKNVHECAETQIKLNKEYNIFTPSTQDVKPSDFKPQGLIAECMAESAANMLNTFKNGFEELSHKCNKIREMEINIRRLIDPLKILDSFNPPNQLKNEKEVFDATFDTLYPRTGEIRKKLIQYNIRIDRVTPRMPKNKRYYITEHKEGWFNMYPRSFDKRLTILEGKTHDKSSIISRIKNLFKSKESLKKEQEVKLEQQKKKYEISKIARALNNSW